MSAIGMPMTPELGEAIEPHLDRIDEAMEPWAADGGYFNFAERPCDVDAILPPTSAPACRGQAPLGPRRPIVANHAVSLEPGLISRSTSNSGTF